MSLGLLVRVAGFCRKTSGDTSVLRRSTDAEEARHKLEKVHVFSALQRRLTDGLLTRRCCSHVHQSLDQRAGVGDFDSLLLLLSQLDDSFIGVIFQHTRERAELVGDQGVQDVFGDVADFQQQRFCAGLEGGCGCVQRLLVISWVGGRKNTRQILNSALRCKSLQTRTKRQIRSEIDQFRDRKHLFSANLPEIRRCAQNSP